MIGAAPCWLGRREAKGHLAAVCLQNISGDRWESGDVGAPTAVPPNAAGVNVWAASGGRGLASPFATRCLRASGQGLRLSQH